MEAHLPTTEKRRTYIATFFITIMTGIAFHHSIHPVEEFLRIDGCFLCLGFILPFIFIINTIRFFIGNILYVLAQDKEENILSWIWVLDFLFLTAESYIIILSGALCSIESSQNNKMGFFSLIAILLVIDILWIILRISISVIRRTWSRKKIPWIWALINLIPLAAIYLLDDPYAKNSLIWLGIIFTIISVIDVFAVDYFGLLKPNPSGNKNA